MSTIKSVDSPDKLLALVLFCNILAVLMMHSSVWHERVFQRTSPDARQFTVVPKTPLKTQDMGLAKVHRNFFTWGKMPKERTLADMPLLRSLDVRAIRLVGTVMDKGQRFAWISPLKARTAILRIGLHETIGQDGWQVAAIHKESLYLENRLHGKSRHLVFHLPKV